MWGVHKNSPLPLHSDLPAADKLPWTISYVIRKRAQIDSFMELSKEKRPPERMIWYGTPDEIEDWFDKVFSNRTPQNEFVVQVSEDDIG